MLVKKDGLRRRRILFAAGRGGELATSGEDQFLKRSRGSLSREKTAGISFSEDQSLAIHPEHSLLYNDKEHAMYIGNSALSNSGQSKMKIARYQ